MSRKQHLLPDANSVQDRERPLAPAAHSPIKLVSIKELAEELGFGTWTIKKWSEDGQFPKPVFLVDGGHARWRVRDVEAWIEKRRRSRRRPTYKGALKKQMGAGDA